MNQTGTRPNPPPPAMTVGVPGWIRTNLFSSPVDGVITIVLGAIVALAIFQTINWVFITASWEVIYSRVPLYLIGRYPQDLYWRPLTALLIVSVMLGIAWRMWGGIARGFAIAIVIITLLSAILPYAGVDLGAPRVDPNIELEPASSPSPAERQRDISDGIPDNARDLRDITSNTGTLYQLATLDGDEDSTDYYSFTLTETKKLNVGLWQLEADTQT